MDPTTDAARPPDPAQAAELARLVEFEARWENLRAQRRHAASREDPGGRDLHDRQRAYDAFRSRLDAYNRRYAPAHVPELLLNNATRLGRWCRAMRDLFRVVAHDPQAPCPTQLLDKAHRAADRIGGRTGAAWVAPPASPATVPAAVEELDALARWCDGLAGSAAP